MTLSVSKYEYWEKAVYVHLRSFGINQKNDALNWIVAETTCTEAESSQRAAHIIQMMVVVVMLSLTAAEKNENQKARTTRKRKKWVNEQNRNHLEQNIIIIHNILHLPTLQCYFCPPLSQFYYSESIITALFPSFLFIFLFNSLENNKHFFHSNVFQHKRQKSVFIR